MSVVLLNLYQCGRDSAFHLRARHDVDYVRWRDGWGVRGDPGGRAGVVELLWDGFVILSGNEIDQIKSNFICIALFITQVTHSAFHMVCLPKCRDVNHKTTLLNL